VEIWDGGAKTIGVQGGLLQKSLTPSLAKAGIQNSLKILDSGSRFACPE
jgi:hypothetical protein